MSRRDNWDSWWRQELSTDFFSFPGLSEYAITQMLQRDEREGMVSRKVAAEVRRVLVTKRLVAGR